MAHTPTSDLTSLERRLLDEFQRDFPLTPQPYAEIAHRLGTNEDHVIATLARLEAQGFISRIGAVVTPHRAGWSTLAAMSVPDDRFEGVAALVSAYGEVNHNYEREHAQNLWFVVTAADRASVGRVLREIERRTGLCVLDLPLEQSFRLDLGFELQWN